MFELDTRLNANTFEITNLGLCRVLLMNDSQYPWLILVPEISGLTDLCDLSVAQQAQFMVESSITCAVLKTLFAPDRLNVAAIGNIVNQLHIHHVARFETDAAWPGPIWGAFPPIAYTEQERLQLIERLQNAFEKHVQACKL